MKVVALLLMGWLGLAPLQDPGTALAAALTALESEDAGRWVAAFERLEAAGEPAALMALDGFAGRSDRGRISRARLVRACGTAACVPGVLAVLADPDPAVRAELVGFLGRLELGSVAKEERLAALAGRARDDLDPGLRRLALEALANCALDGAAAQLDALLDELPTDERPRAAEALGRLPAGRTRVLRRVRTALTSQAAVAAGVLDPETLAVLLAAYGRALADLPQGGFTAAERAPLVAFRRHPDAKLRRAAAVALDRALSRRIALDRIDLAERLLTDLADDGFEPRNMATRRLFLALEFGDDAEHVRVLANELLASATPPAGDGERMWRFYALLARGVGELALDRLAAADADFVRAGAELTKLESERVGQGPAAPARSRFDGSLTADLQDLLGVVELWRAVVLLAEVEPSPLAALSQDRTAEPQLLEHARRAHQHLLIAQLVSNLHDVDGVALGIDSLLERDIGPRRLLLAGSRHARWPSHRGLAVLVHLGRLMTTVAAPEISGFEPYALPADSAPGLLTDPVRGRLLLDSVLALENMYDARIGREAGRPVIDRARVDSLRRQREFVRRRLLEALESSPRLPRAGWRAPEGDLAALMLEQRPPAMHALKLALELQADGRGEAARRLARAMLADLREGVPGGGAEWVEWTSARLELTIGSTYAEEGRGSEAASAYLEAARRLENLETSFERRIENPTPQEESQRGWYEQVLAQTRSMRADALLALAVNSNVKLRRPEQATAYFEEAYSLKQTDFFRVLLACYRARDGRDAEARALLRTITPAPAVFYNLACTHALLGELDRALDYLERELEENPRSATARQRQGAWAASDPDLAALRELPRFRRLIRRARQDADRVE